MSYGPDGSLLFSDVFSGVEGSIRRLGTDGVVTTILGKGDNPADGVPAASAMFNGSFGGFGVQADGSIVFLDFGDAVRVRAIGSDGLVRTLSTIASSSQSLVLPFSGVGRDASGNLYVDVAGQVQRLTLGGALEPIVGCRFDSFADACADPSEGMPSFNAFLFWMFVAPDGSIYTIDNNQVLRVSSFLPAYARASFLVASSDGLETFGFDGTGRHVATFDALTGVKTLAFNYDQSGALVSVVDRDGLTTSIERDANGQPVAIVAPFGQRTSLGLDANGYLSSVTNPAGERTELTYSADGLMISLKDARGATHSFEYDADGRLVKDTDPSGGFKTLARTELASGGDHYAVKLSTKLGRTTTYEVENLPAGAKTYRVTSPAGLVTTTEVRADGKIVAKTPDGMQTESQSGPREPFGMQAPMVVSRTEKTPAGLERQLKRNRAVELGQAPFSVAKVTETVSINDNPWKAEYDASTRQMQVTSPQGRQTIATLDDKGRPVKTELPGLAPLAIAYDDRGRPKSAAQGERQQLFAYDAQGHLSSITDPLSRVLAMQSDPIGRVLKQIGPDGSATALRYDANSNIVGLTPPGRTEYGFGYTPVDLESSFTPPAVDSWSPATSYSYDTDQALTSIARPDGVNVAMTHDSAGRVAQIDHPRGPVKLGYSPTTGQLVSAQTPEETLAYAYDGRLLTGVTWSGAVGGR
jgi:YD repeat-containing protein